jgi:glucosylceramidase
VLGGQAPAAPDALRWRVSSEDLRLRLAEQTAITWQTAAAGGGAVIEVNPAESFQTMLGLGSSLEPATYADLSRMSAADRERTLDRLVSPSAGIGMNLMRICIGTPDFTGDPWYSYDDLPPGETDPELRRFSIGKDRAYEAEGIPIHAVTIQNEPGVDRSFGKDPKWHYPPCRWTAAQELEFIRDHLGPAFRRHGLRTRIWTYDHNYNVEPRAGDAGLAYPRAILRDPAAARAVSGVTFHGYVGAPSGMSVFHQEFPDVPLHLTEGSVFGLRGGSTLIAKLRNFASSYNAWVTILDERGKPNNGPFEASRMIITLDSATLKPIENFDDVLYGQFMKFIQRGAVRVASSESGKALAHVACRNPDGSFALVVVNAGRAPQAMTLRRGTRAATAELPGASVATFIWKLPETRD